MPEDKTELEKPTERIIELNEWFTPYVDYDNLPYNTLPGGIPYRGDSLIHKDQKTYIFIWLMLADSRLYYIIIKI